MPNSIHRFGRYDVVICGAEVDNSLNFEVWHGLRLLASFVKQDHAEKFINIVLVNI